MTEFKHTKGPWKIHDDFDFDSFISGETGKFENVICQSPKSHKMGKNGCAEYEPWHNNKVLISCAPEMLEILIGNYETYLVLEECFKGKNDIIWGMIQGAYFRTSKQTKDIIEKATGLKIEDII